MRTFKYLMLTASLTVFVACQNPYDKPQKEPVKIGIAQYVVGQNAKDGGDASAEATLSAEEMIDLDNKGIGPVKNVVLGDQIDQAMADAGKQTFNTLCIACHKMDSRFVGPALKGILDIRSPEWVMNMIINPIEMVQKDPIGIQLLKEYKAPMADLGLTEQQAREVVEYFRTVK